MDVPNGRLLHKCASFRRHLRASNPRIAQASKRAFVFRGTYQVEAKLIDFERCTKVSRLRAILAGSEFNLDSKCGEVSLHFAAVAVGDFEIARNDLNEREQEKLNKWALRAIGSTVCANRSWRFCTHTVSLVLCRAAFGDWTYPIFRINERRRVVGFEVEFIPDGHVWR